MVVGTDSDAAEADRLLRPVTKVKASGADALFYGGYYAEAGLLIEAAA